VEARDGVFELELRAGAIGRAVGAAEILRQGGPEPGPQDEDAKVGLRGARICDWNVSVAEHLVFPEIGESSTRPRNSSCSRSSARMASARSLPTSRGEEMKMRNRGRELIDWSADCNCRKLASPGRDPTGL